MAKPKPQPRPYSIVVFLPAGDPDEIFSRVKLVLATWSYLRSRPRKGLSESIRATLGQGSDEGSLLLSSTSSKGFEHARRLLMEFADLRVE
jgi:hypothetical protein